MAAKKKKRKKKANLGRFVIVLLVLLILAGGTYGFLRLKRYLTARATTGTAREALLGNYYTGTLIIARDEKLFETENKTTVDFVAAEGGHVNRGSTICSVYASGYNATEVSRLEGYRESIQNYHTGQVFDSYVDAALESENHVIADLAGQVRSLVRGRGVGSFSNLERQLGSELTARKNYLKQKYPDDQALNLLYKEESDQIKKIESWTTTYNATEDCLVSFYTDGYEAYVNAETYASLTPADARIIIRGGKLNSQQLLTTREPIFRTISEDIWYGLFLCSDKEFNPSFGETYKLQLEGFGEAVIEGSVQSFTRVGGDLLLRLRIDDSVEPVINLRTCGATVGSYISGFYVPMRALYSYNNALGVVCIDGGSQVFVETTVVSYPDKDTAFVQPVLEGSPLTDGKKLMLF